ncbi:MAG: preprotein translocase subunit SecY, partial [Haloarculaceae archaeon]
MNWKATVEPVLVRMPSVERPDGHVPFREKLAWTTGVLVLYFFLTNVFLFGLGSGSQDVFGQFRSILAGGQGTVLQLGIGPIVTASIVLQLLNGADLLGLDTSDPRDQQLYQGLQKLLVVAMICLTGLPMVFAGSFLPVAPKLASQYGTLPIKWLMFLQIFLGGVLVLAMDEVVSKWGVGSGISLFIVAGVSQRLVGGLFAAPILGNPNPGIVASWVGILSGAIPVGSPLTASGIQDLLVGPGQLLPVFTTLLIFGIVVYAESVRVEIPLSHTRVKGARGRFPVKLIYASVLPLLLVRALQANIQFLGRILYSQWGDSMPHWLGVYTTSRGGAYPVSGLFYYLNPIQAPQQWMWWLGGTAADPWQVGLRVLVDLVFMLIGGAIFAVFWVETADMGPDATARQILNSGMQIPGFRQSESVMRRVLTRYIPQITVIGGAIVGVLAVLANMLGTIGGVSGTSLLLTVSITYKLYEEIAEE